MENLSLILEKVRTGQISIKDAEQKITGLFSNNNLIFSIFPSIDRIEEKAKDYSASTRVWHEVDGFEESDEIARYYTFIEAVNWLKKLLINK